MLMIFGIDSALADEAYLQRFADVSDKAIVFTYENDLWLVPLDGGTAKRITRAEGTEIFAKFSPDGKMIAFTANYDGGNDVYVMEVNGSEPQRLTWHPARDLTLDWYPDGKHILFRSVRNYPTRAQQLYKVSLDGSAPEMLPVDRAGLAALSPDAKFIAYNRGSREFRNWKRHKGGTAQDIWMGSLEKKDYHKITTFDGTDNFPMWSGDFIYFTSDRNFGTMNLFKYNVKTKQLTALTRYKDYDVKYPSLGPGHIVYQYGEQLYLYNLKTGETKKVKIEIPSDKIFTRFHYVSGDRNVGNFGLSADGAFALFSVRGEIIKFPAGDTKAPVINLSQAPGSREKDAVWSSDGKKIAFFSDKTGEEELYIINADGSGAWRQVTKGNKGFRMNPVWSPNSRYLLFHDKYMRLNLADTRDNSLKIIDKGDYDDAWELWGIQDYAWSPDSRYVAYAKLEQSLYQSIFIYDLTSDKIYRITEETTQDWSPSFSKDGRYLFFLSNRDFRPVMGFVDQNHIFLDMAKPYAFILKKGDISPFDKIHRKDKKGKKSKVKTVFTPGDYEARTVAAPVKAANLFRLEVLKKGLLYLKKTENEFLKYQTVTDANSSRNLNLCYFDFSSGKEKTLMEGISQYHISADGKKLIYKAGNSWGVVEAGKKASARDGALALSGYKMLIYPEKEFSQIYNEAWRVQRDWFYDKNMHGLNWQKVREKYGRFLPYCGNREDVNYLIGEMIAELNAGHTYIYGGDRESYDRISVGTLGADFSYENGYPKIYNIHRGWLWDSHSPLLEPGCPVKEGAYILAVNGVKIQANTNIYKYLQNTAGKLAEITYNYKPSWKNSKTWLLKTMRSEYNLKYREWYEKNRKYVADKTGGKVAYIHLPGMMENGLIEFARLYYPNYYKDGIIIDARYNGGGFTSKMILDRLERRLQSLSQPREGKPITEPERVFNGRLVLLINHDTGSDGELFSESWKRRKLGPIVGERTWGGAVGIEPHQHLLDGAITTPPQFGPYSFPSQWIIEGHGVEPDIVVVNMPKDVLNGKDAQLDKAIEVILENIKKNPPKYPARPPYPDKSKPSLK